MNIPRRSTFGSRKRRLHVRFGFFICPLTVSIQRLLAIVSTYAVRAGSFVSLMNRSSFQRYVHVGSFEMHLQSNVINPPNPPIFLRVCACSFILDALAMERHSPHTHPATPSTPPTCM